MLNEVRHLHELGFAIHLLHPRSKAPIGNNWSTVPRASWEQLQKRYKDGMNVGVRLGQYSKVGDGYLAVIDLDLRSEDPLHKKEMWEAFHKAFPHTEHAPVVASGRANGSAHIYVLTKTPIREKRIASNLKHWSIVLMGEGRQVVLPPSVHPDTGKNYTWTKVPNGSWPFIESESLPIEPKRAALRPRVPFSPEDVDLSKLPSRISEGIIRGAEVEDRSAFMLWAAQAMLKARYTDNQILSALSDPSNYIGQAVPDHTDSQDRGINAQWVTKYTLPKARLNTDPRNDFLEDVVETELNDEDADTQWQRLVGGWRTKLLWNAKRTALRPCFMNSLLIFENEFGKELFHKDDFSLRRTYGVDTPWGTKKDKLVDDEDIIAMRRYLCENHKVDIKEHDISATVTSISARNHHHPLREYLSGLEWDGIPRIDSWLKDYAGVKVLEGYEPYLEAVSRKVLCAMVTRAYYPGTKFDTALVLEGPNQGEGKSRSIRALASPEWSGSVRFDMDHKDFVLALQGRWITEISELSGLGRKNTAFVKAIVAEESDRIRHPYGRFTETLPRQGIFIGTTNHFQYLEDETGNRRFWPVRVGLKINVEGLAAIRDQLFAEAKFACEMGETLYLDDATDKLAREIQMSRMSEDSWGDTLADYLDKTPGIFKLKDLFSVGGPLEDRPDSEAHLRRACRVLRRLGYFSKDMKGHAGHGKYWTNEK